MKRRVELDYTLNEGWLAPWLEGLRQGQAVGSHCLTCRRVQFPPLRVCPDCATPSDAWQTLTGAATLLFRTDGMDGSFALVHFDGASRAVVARADVLPPGAARCHLAACPDDPPILALKPEPLT